MQILVFQHLDVEHPGVFRDFWKKAGHDVHTVHFNRDDIIPPLEDFDLLVVLGGPMDVWETEQNPWLVREMSAIYHWVRNLEKPYFGICLGHQLLAQALGGHVGLMKKPEVGLATIHVTTEGQQDPLFANAPHEMEIFQWHGAEVQTLPEGAVVLAANAACPVQAMRVGPHAWGLQYHVEMTDTTVAEWSAIPEYKASMEKALGAERAATLETTLAPLLPGFNAMAHALNENLFTCMTPHS
ncbi:type 1 glutamine amidotransferase [Acetobacter suratthaniensis]|nr:type 1 glutamine amidotransferase [Acetobacter suratthaniensis]MCX2566744.1 type 1 glutamine amidotransferase [Acetobacter suratthaniensis]